MKVDQLQKSACIDLCPECHGVVDSVTVQVSGSGAFAYSEAWANPCDHYVEAAQHVDAADDRRIISLSRAPKHLAGRRRTDA